LRADLTLFISDLHLSESDPATLGRFLSFLAGPASKAGRLYILGDFFEAWVGDDDLSSALPSAVSQALRKQADDGLEVLLMHGNRDFLLGEGFCRASGCRLVSEPVLVDLYGTPTLLMHGDSLCTDDVAYQAYRGQVRNPTWQQAVLARPLSERRTMAAQMLDQSSLAKDGKSMILMDVNPEAVADAFRSHGCERLIHGHTHRPAHHQHDVDGRQCERWVLTDWYAGKGGYLRCDHDGCQAVAF
jgi:UDP-2,3-diacylglucosamine hydrolase